MSNETPAFTEAQAMWLTERIMQANDTLLQGSRQAGFMAAAIIAASPLWMPTTGPSTLARFAVVALALSIACSAVAHLMTGLPILRHLMRISQGQDTSSKTQYLPWAWTAGIVQATLALFALVVFVVNLW